MGKGGGEGSTHLFPFTPARKKKEHFLQPLKPGGSFIPQLPLQCAVRPQVVKER